ncbi:MAG: nickel pincer cofactor biosynthesis protein LarB [Acidobacteriota bacterium]|nr:nickel pincer cofactor biosynthesis protein LarB [Acidobacteriota bacterium]
MRPDQIRALLEAVQSGTLDLTSAQEELTSALRRAPFEDLGFARIDHHRVVRQGFPEVVFGQGKTAAQIATISERIVAAGHNLLITRTTRDVFEAVRADVPDAIFHKTARVINHVVEEPEPGHGTILVVSGGTSDQPVAEEAVVSAETMGNRVERLYDVGVAGIHRLLSEQDRLGRARVIIVVAGMEGALASVVGGLVRAPVIGVPTSVGYGTGFGGVAPLLSMLNSCATGVGVVNIDNGFGAAALASLITHA